MEGRRGILSLTGASSITETAGGMLEYLPLKHRETASTSPLHGLGKMDPSEKMALKPGYVKGQPSAGSKELTVSVREGGDIDVVGQESRMRHTSIALSAKAISSSSPNESMLSDDHVEVQQAVESNIEPAQTLFSLSSLQTMLGKTSSTLEF